MDNLTERVNNVFHDFDPYEYQDCDMSYEEVEDLLAISPHEVIRILCSIAEELME